nr:uncharacterized protein LOC123494830 [Aegilops tauschii subsp. strangulata]
MKPLFLADLIRIDGLIAVPWLLIGDFNLIYEARDKSNTNLNLNLMVQFRSALNVSDLVEIKLCGRRFTWSNEQRNPTLVGLDRAFCSPDWNVRFGTANLQPLATAMSDHCPLLLSCDGAVPKRGRFRFEAFWPHIEGFKDVVAHAWSQPCAAVGPVARLNAKLRPTARALRLWHKHHIGDTKLQLLMAQDMVALLDKAQEERLLEPDEVSLRQNSEPVLDGSKLEKRIPSFSTSRPMRGDGRTTSPHSLRTE